MHFTPAIAAAVLAFVSTASAAPAASSGYESSTSTYYATETTSSSYAPESTSSYYATTSSYETKATETATYKSSAAAPTPSADLAALGLSKTQQILLQDTRVDVFNNVLKESKDVVFDFNANAMNGPGKGGEVIAANRKTFPALTGLGIGAAFVKLNPCGFNTEHVHRATELAFVTKGKIVSSMFPENGVVNADGSRKEYLNTLTEGQMMVLPLGAVHYQFNPTCEDAYFFAAQSNEDFGVGQVLDEVFNTAELGAVAAAFSNKIDKDDVAKLRDSLATNVAIDVDQCLKRCNKSS